LPEEFTLLPPQPAGWHSTFIRGNLFDRSEMRLLPSHLPGPDNDLSDRIEHYVKRAIEESSAMVYAFGQRWGPEQGVPDKVFDFKPGNGIHDIHMNQGNNAAYRNGRWRMAGRRAGVALSGERPMGRVFLAFQSQAWHTDDATGHAIEVVEEPDKTVRIVAAMVNPVGGEPEAETVILLNPTPRPIDLAGWHDRGPAEAQVRDSRNAAAGGVVTVALRAPTKLGNSGGIITLLNAQGLKVDGVSYTNAQAKREGWLVVHDRRCGSLGDDRAAP
jgi:uncharacterized protein YukJ